MHKWRAGMAAPRKRCAVAAVGDNRRSAYGGFKSRHVMTQRQSISGHIRSFMVDVANEAV